MIDLTPPGCPAEDSFLAYLTQVRPDRDTEPMLAHLDRCTPCRQLVAEATRALGISGARGCSPQTLVPGDVLLDRYEIRDLVGRGGMGEVHEAYDRVRDQDIALKTLLPAVLNDHRAALRFKAEASLAGKISHPNVCRVLEFGIHARPARFGLPPEAIPFFTMELLRGETLRQRAKRLGSISRDDLTDIVWQIAAALRAMHEASVVHRDLKTENVFLVSAPSGRERAVVMDFGLARAMDGSIVSTSPTSKVLAGTISCMSPEQAEGRPADAASDIFALGVLVFELLTGQRPFAPNPTFGALRGLAPLPSTRAPGIEPAWDRIVARCLETDPTDRYRSVQNLMGDLPRLASQRPRGWVRALGQTLATSIGWFPRRA
jgi:serine/threonine protein kinase